MNEVLKYGGDVFLSAVHKLYTVVFDSEVFPVQWAQGIIVPLFKGGAEDFRYDPGKYRGITLLSVLGKTYTAVLNNRLSNWIENNNILADEQAGFRPNRSITDQLFVLTETIRNRRPNKTFCAFLDIQKAYDKVWREGLWYKLYKAGVRGKLWRIIRGIYAKVESCVALGDNLTTFFEILVVNRSSFKYIEG